MDSETQMELRGLSYKLRTIKGSITKFNTFLDNVSNEIIDPIRIKTRLSKIKELWSEYFDTQMKLECIQENGASESDEDFEEKYFGSITRAEKLLATQSQSNNLSNNQVNNGIANNHGQDTETNVRLPRISLPLFSGNLEDWLPFYETFQSLIHTNETLSNVQKLHYLKSCLKGDAASCIQDLQISSANYEIAWTTLKARFDNKRLIIRKHIQAIYELPTSTQENAATLRQILDNAQKHTRALKALNRPVDQWDDWLIYQITNKLDRVTNKDWESSIESDRIPSFKELLDFLTRKCNTLESISKSCTTSNQHTKFSKPIKTLSHIVRQGMQCHLCKGTHFLYQCSKFLNMSIEDRINQVKTSRLCLNCLRSGHQATNCTSSNCRRCNKKHNTLIHTARESAPEPNRSPSCEDDSRAGPSNVISACTSNASYNPSHVLLSTAIVKVADKQNQFHQCRVLLDSGSQSHFISKSFADKLDLKYKPTHVPISGIGKNSTVIDKSVSTYVRSNHSRFEVQLTCLVIDHITNEIPTETSTKDQLDIPKNIKLADPQFNIPRRIYMLIGAEIFWHLLCIGQIKLKQSNVVLQKTHFGWIISGSLPQKNHGPLQSSCNVALEDPLHLMLQRFWEIEESSQVQPCTPEEKACENHFVATHRRSQEGRFIVELPFKQNPHSLGDSRDTAIQRFYALERKFAKQPKLKQEYTEFLNEYLSLGHMKRVDPLENTDVNFYLPHHAVLKQDSLTTKLRVVFDGSAKTSSGKSLNDILMVGPTVQQELFSIVCRFRTHKTVLTADATKMYRQLLVNEHHTRFQRIVWRDYPAKPLETYELLTVTYGTASASFLATRALKQLSLEESSNFPTGSRVIAADFYVDDLLTGADTDEAVEKIFVEVNEVLQRGGFELRKWASNDVNILNKLLPNATTPVVLNLDKDSQVKALGVQWNSHLDVLQYSVLEPSVEKRCTKRTILSRISQIFDPLGLLGPVIVTAKMLLQVLWQLKLSWDESLPIHLYTEWRRYQESLLHLNSLQIDRNAVPYKNTIELHGFCDASEKAYGACIYVRSMNDKGHISSKLLCSKSRVAPLQSTTIPRLELCAAVLLARLMVKVESTLSLKIDHKFYWTDSTIVLAWINTTTRQLKTFAANRVAEIQTTTTSSEWRHVSTNENPADLLSRGSPPDQLIDCNLWWQGPTWLLQHHNDWLQSTYNLKGVEIPEKRNIAIISNVVQQKIDLFDKFSSLSKLQRVVSFVRRFIHNALCRVQKTPQHTLTGPLSTNELYHATRVLLKSAQGDAFAAELKHFTKGKPIQPESCLRNLNLFLDSEGIIRVGGRLRNSNNQFNEKHPIILPKNHQITRLLIEYVHRTELHAGAQATLAKIRTKYWPLGGRSIVRHVIRKCIKCFKAKPIMSQPLMGDLPMARVQPARPFINVGVDYCGPFTIRNSPTRRASTYKAYVAIFVCMAVKAVHIELVSGLDSNSFISALKRFIARRGMISNIYSDNGTNFVKANKDLKELQKMFTTTENIEKITNVLAEQGVSWHFIPPKAPNFGGLWEAAVKSFKHHFRRIVSNALLTFEEFYTICTQIEAILNSRPLIPLSEDPSDLSILTPSHFLIGDSLRSNLEPNLSEIKLNRLSRFQLLERIRQHFWARWSKEYLQQLQVRKKWTQNISPSVRNGQLVLLQEDGIPPLLWPTGRIVAVHPGVDGIVRAATVKTVRGEVKRPTNKLCVLPME